MKVLGVIPARGGSKGIPNKNIKLLNGKPLIYYSILEGLQSTVISDLIVSTDDKEIKKIAENFGANCPFIRPSDLSNDTALAIPTIQHALFFMEKMKKFKYDYVVMLQPTSPLRTSTDIDKAIDMLIKSGSDGIISVVNVDNNHPMKMKKFLGKDQVSGKMVDYEKPPVENCPRQKLPPVFIVNGAIYATKRNVLINDNSFQGQYCEGYVMSPERSINIDTIYDFYIAEKLMKGK